MGINKDTSGLRKEASDLQKVQQAVAEQSAQAQNQNAASTAASQAAPAAQTTTVPAQTQAQPQQAQPQQTQPQQTQPQQTQPQQTQPAKRQSQEQTNGMNPNATYTDAAGNQYDGYVINGVTYSDPYGKNPISIGSTVTMPDGTQWYKGENGSVQLGPGKGMATPVSYTDGSGSQYRGYVINGITYTDPYGKNPIATGSTVTMPDGTQWYKGENGSVQLGNGQGMATPVSYTDASGRQHQGYVINGVTYSDPYGNNPIAAGSTVTMPDGTQWYKGNNGSVLVENEYTIQKELSDLSYLINQQYDAAQQAAQQQINYGTQQSMDQLMRAMQDAQPQYEDAIANQLLETRQAQDAQALRNQINGDRGGIGSSQVDSIGNTGARNREAIAQQQRQLASDTARQIADLRAQGKYSEAQTMLQVAQQRLSALYNEQVRLQQEQATWENQKLQLDQANKSNLASLAKTLLNAGIMPNDDMLIALGLDRNLASAWVDKVNGTTGNTGNAGGNTGPGGNNGDKVEPITGDPVTKESQLSENGKRLFGDMNVMNWNTNGSNYASNSLGATEKIVEALSRGQITGEEAAFLGRFAGVRSQDGGTLDAQSWINMAMEWR